MVSPKLTLSIETRDGEIGVRRMGSSSLTAAKIQAPD